MLQFSYTSATDAKILPYCYTQNILDPRSKRAGSYKFGAVIVNV